MRNSLAIAFGLLVACGGDPSARFVNFGPAADSQVDPKNASTEDTPVKTPPPAPVVKPKPKGSGGTTTSGTTGPSGDSGTTGPDGASGATDTGTTTVPSTPEEKACAAACKTTVTCAPDFDGTEASCRAECEDFSDLALSDVSAECQRRNTILDNCTGTLSCSAYNGNTGCEAENFYFGSNCGGRESRCNAYCGRLGQCFTGFDVGACRTACNTELADRELSSYTCGVKIYGLYECLTTASCSGLADYFDENGSANYVCKAQDIAAGDACL